MLAFSFFPRKLTAWFRMNTSHQKYICEPLPSSRACTQSHFAVLCPKRSYAARTFSKSLKFSLSLKGLCSYLEVLRERERESELLWTQNSDALCMRVLKICERFNPSTCRCGGFECRPWLSLQMGCARWTVGRIPDSESTWHGCGSKPTGLRLNRWTSTPCWFTLTFGRVLDPPPPPSL